MQERIQAARAVFAWHRERTGQVRCGLCGGPWHHTTIKAAGIPLAGCAARQLAGRFLHDHGQLDRRGNPITLQDET